MDLRMSDKLPSYLEMGYKNRLHYLECLAEEYDRDKVFVLAHLFGPSEDFDGLITALEDDCSL